MSALDQVQALWSVYRSRGMLASLDHVDEHCEWIPPPSLADGRPIQGAAQMRRYIERLETNGVRFEPVLHTCEEVGDGVVVAGGRMRVVSEAALSDSPLYWVYRVEGERLVRIESYPCRSDALAAAAEAA